MSHSEFFPSNIMVSFVLQIKNLRKYAIDFQLVTLSVGDSREKKEAVIQIIYNQKLKINIK